jgi:hypothetical protein
MRLDWKVFLLLVTVLVISRLFPTIFDHADIRFVVVALLLLGALTFIAYWFYSRTLQRLREWTPEMREAFFTRLHDAALGPQLRRDLARDLETYQSGEVERFGFAPSLKREATILYWLLASFVGMGILMTSRVGRPSWWLAGGVAVVAVFAFIGLLHLMRWRRYLDTWLEISRFGLSEVWPDGSRRTILWNSQLLLLNQPRRKRVRVFFADTNEGICVHFRRTYYARAIRLVFEFGGFVPAKPAA